MSNEYLKSMTSFSGADLLVAFGKKVIGELQQISWAVQRRKAPIFTLGSSDYRSVSRGVRGVAGSLTFVVFDRDALIEEVKEIWEEIAPPAMYTAAGNTFKVNTDSFAQAVAQSGWGGTEDPFRSEENLANQTFEGWNQTGSNAFDQAGVPAGFTEMTKDDILYADTLPPFDITMTYANEYGQAAFQKIYDVDIMNESSGVSVDSTLIERNLTYMARRISPMMKGVYNRSGSQA